MKRTKEVSELTGVSRRTLQYYDDEGVLTVERSKDNHRLYDREALEKIWKIMVYKEMGFDLKRIKQLLSVPDCEQKNYLRRQIQAAEAKIDQLRRQSEFISLVLTKGMPRMPGEHTGETYKARISELRRGNRYE